MDGIPTIETERLTLRALTPADSPEIFALFGSADVTRHYDLATFETMDQAESFVRTMADRFDSGLGIRWGITLRGDNKVRGTCGVVWRPHNHSAVLGYDLHPDHWGQGYATEAVRGILDAAFDSLAPFVLNRVEAFTYPENRASSAVLRKLDFKEEGLLRQWGFWKDSYHDLVCHSLLRADWLAGGAKPQQLPSGGG